MRGLGLVTIVDSYRKDPWKSGDKCYAYIDGYSFRDAENPVVKAVVEYTMGVDENGFLDIHTVELIKYEYSKLLNLK